jgi:two-component system response regulator MtrA
MSVNEMNELYRVLVIEDDEEVGRLLCLSLNGAGLSCQTATDGQSALQLFKEQAPHLVLLDWMLPGMSGQEVLDALRAQSDVPILVVSALADESNAGAFPGTDGHIGKPFNPARLNRRVQEILRERYSSTGAGRL